MYLSIKCMDMWLENGVAVVPPGGKNVAGDGLSQFPPTNLTLPRARSCLSKQSGDGLLRTITHLSREEAEAEKGRVKGRIKWRFLAQLFTRLP